MARMMKKTPPHTEITEKQIHPPPTHTHTHTHSHTVTMTSEDGWKEGGGAREGNRKVDLKILFAPEG